MGKIKKFFDNGGGSILLIPSFIILGIIAGVYDCSRKNKKEKEMEMVERIADSLRTQRIEEETREMRETIEHRLSFFNKISRVSSFFETYEHFEEWLSRANNTAFELLYSIYSERYHDFFGEQDLANYLHWAPPEYELSCDRCGETITFFDY